MNRLIKATQLKKGDEIVYHFGSAVVLEDPKVGYLYVNFVTKNGKTRIGINDEILIEDPNYIY